VAINDAAFIGYWKIIDMEVWGPDDIDLVVPGFLEFERVDDHVMGQFQFGTVVGWLDCRLREVGGESFVEWSWEGQNDNDPGCGRGWAKFENGKLVGRLYLYRGDDSAFQARKEFRPSGTGRARRGRTRRG